MTWQLMSALTLPIGMTIYFAYDYAAFRCAGVAGTISGVCYYVAQHFPVYLWAICYEFGLLPSHLFGHNPWIQLSPWVYMPVVVALPLLIALVVLFFGIETPTCGRVTHDYRMGVICGWLIVGVLARSAFVP